MSQIIVRDLVKTFRIAQRRAGTFGALMGLVRRDYRVVRALDGVSFAIEPGELIGYIGPNGGRQEHDRQGPLGHSRPR